MRSLQQIIEDAKGKHHDERAKNIRGSYRFDVADAGSFRLEVNDGELRFAEDDRPADCVLALDADDFVRILEGEQNMLTAFMQGRLTIEGDLALAKAFHGAIGMKRAERSGEVHP